MTARKVLKGLILALVGFVLLAGGYWWGRNQMMSEQGSPPSQSATAKMGGMEGMKGMEGADADKLASGSVNVSPEKQQLVGIRTAVVELRPLVKKIRTVSIVTYDETKVAQVFTKVDGWIEKLFVNYTGQLVEKGQPLFTLYSQDLVATQDEYLLALQSNESLGSSSLPEIRAGSVSLLEATRRRLRLWDISDQQIAELEKSRRPNTTLTFFSPISGFVLKKDALQGMRVMPDKELYTITDLSTVWVNADIYEYELAQIRVGQKATIRVDSYPARDFVGKVTWISPVLDEKTRTAKVRLEFPNRDFLLKPEMYANAEIEINAGRKLAVPDEAVLDSGLRKVVFLDKGEGRFEPAEVKIGNKFDGYYEVLAGLSPGERILASASFLLDSESRLKEAMGAMAGMPGMDEEKGGMKTGGAATTGPQEKKSQELKLVLSTEPKQTKTGENLVRVMITDNAGKPVGDAKVSFVFNMAGMVPSKAEGKLSRDGVYEAKTNFSMAGSWEIGVSVQRPVGKPVQEKFTVTAQ